MVDHEEASQEMGQALKLIDDIDNNREEIKALTEQAVADLPPARRDEAKEHAEDIEEILSNKNPPKNRLKLKLTLLTTKIMNA